MKAKKWLTIITLCVSIFSLSVACIIGKDSNCISYDVSMALLGSAVLGFIMSLTEYYVEKRKAMEEFWLQSNKILKEMNRKYTKEDYLAKIEKVKKRIPNISLSTDIIVGFPTETKEDFEETLDVLRKVEYDNIFSFIYSRREGTPAAKLDFVLTDEEIHENFNKLLEVQNEISKRKNEAYVGRVEKVLVDGVSKNDETTLSGRCDSSKIVNFKGDKSLIGKYIDVRITEAHTWSLNGEIAE